MIVATEFMEQNGLQGRIYTEKSVLFLRKDQSEHRQPSEGSVEPLVIKLKKDSNSKICSLLTLLMKTTNKDVERTLLICDYF